MQRTAERDCAPRAAQSHSGADQKTGDSRRSCSTALRAISAEGRSRRLRLSQASRVHCPQTHADPPACHSGPASALFRWPTRGTTSSTAPACISRVLARRRRATTDQRDRAGAPRPQGSVTIWHRWCPGATRPIVRRIHDAMQWQAPHVERGGVASAATHRPTPASKTTSRCVSSRSRPIWPDIALAHRWRAAGATIDHGQRGEAGIISARPTTVEADHPTVCDT